MSGRVGMFIEKQWSSSFSANLVFGPASAQQSGEQTLSAFWWRDSSVAIVVTCLYCCPLIIVVVVKQPAKGTIQVALISHFESETDFFKGGLGSTIDSFKNLRARIF